MRGNAILVSGMFRQLAGFGLRASAARQPKPAVPDRCPRTNRQAPGR